jgi:2-polyprenyl-3-methyl-5-hydroxy-6-metoxy-1,4-benzoquinol methylase
MKNSNNWWRPNHFFNKVYLLGDNSVEGYDTDNKSLYERTQNEVNGIIQLTGISKTDKILDAPCGYGRHSIEIAKRGFETWGVDVNPQFIINAQEQAIRDKLINVNFICSNINFLNLEIKFDIALNLFFSIGFYRTEERNLLFLKAITDHIKNNGLLLLHTHIFKERFLYDNIILNETRNLKNNKKLVINKEIKDDREEGYWSIVSNNRVIKKSFYSMRIYSLDELIEMLSKLGMEVINVFGDWSGNMFIKEKSHHLIIICRKHV